MTDLTEARALAAAARADTCDGLAARELLPDVVDALCGQVEALAAAEAVIRRLETMPLRVDEERRIRYLTSADLGHALYDDDPERAWRAMSRSLPGILAGLRDKLSAEAPE